MIFDSDDFAHFNVYILNKDGEVPYCNDKFWHNNFAVYHLNLIENHVQEQQRQRHLCEAFNSQIQTSKPCDAQ